MATKYTGHYSYITQESHRDVFKIILLIILLLIIAVGVWVVSRLFGVSQSTTVTSQPPPAEKILTDEERMAIMARPPGVKPDTSLSDLQRKEIMRAAVNSIKKDTTLTDEQRRAIMSGQ